MKISLDPLILTDPSHLRRCAAAGATPHFWLQHFVAYLVNNSNFAHTYIPYTQIRWLHWHWAGSQTCGMSAGIMICIYMKILCLVSRGTTLALTGVASVVAIATLVFAIKAKTSI